jgi:hypothetical protein
MHRWTLRFALLICAGTLLAGCGSSSSSTSTTTPPPATTTAVPGPTPGHAVCSDGVVVQAEAGACIRQEEEAHGRRFGRVPPFQSTTPSQGVDISNFQGIPNLRASGIRFVIIQTNDGAFRNPFFWLQAHDAQNAGLPWGTYTFLEGFSGAEQARASASMAAGVGLHRTLGMWSDSEIDAAYAHTCAYNAEAALHAHIVGSYGSPGTYRGGRCKGYDWVARWSRGPAGALPGYPSSATILRQWCGTCRLPGFSGEVDRDESLGLLSLALVPKPAPPAPTSRLVAQRKLLRGLLSRHHCRQPPWHVAVGLSGLPNGRYQHACHSWLRRGAVINSQLRARGVR